jgi:hypothetical protein
VRGVALWIALWIVWLAWLACGCAPDYAHSAFLCDATHDCPGEQTCLDGRCRRDPATSDGVTCGGAACGPAQQCCVDSNNPPARCIAAGEVCPGTGALCDNRADCRATDRCCADGDLYFCDATCQHYTCLADADCPPSAPRCCPDDETIWGRCDAVGC